MNLINTGSKCNIDGKGIFFIVRNQFEIRFVLKTFLCCRCPSAVRQFAVR